MFHCSIEKHLLEIFENLHTFYNNIESRLKAEGFKTRVLNVLKAWDDWAVYSKDFLLQLRSIFLGKQVNILKQYEFSSSSVRILF